MVMGEYLNMAITRTKRATEGQSRSNGATFSCPHCLESWQGRKTLQINSGQPIRCPRCSRKLPGGSPEKCCCADCTARREK